MNSTYACQLCDGQGWQKFELTCPQMGMQYVQVRACACSKAPEKQRKETPLRPPAWERDGRGVWIGQTLTALNEFPCNCYNCKPWLYEGGRR
jgi:hypothetical protein